MGRGTLIFLIFFVLEYMFLDISHANDCITKSTRRTKAFFIFIVRRTRATRLNPAIKRVMKKLIDLDIPGLMGYRLSDHDSSNLKVYVSSSLVPL